MTTENKKTLLNAIDDGYAQTKVYGERPDGTIGKYHMRSSVRPGRYGVGSISGDGFMGLYDTEEGPFTASEEVEAESTQFDNFHTSTMNRVLVNHGLVGAGLGGLDVDIITGLPVADFFGADGLKDEAKIALKKANLQKSVQLVSGSSKVANIKNITIGCQAVAAYIDYALDDDLNEIRDVDGAVAIVDIGGRTTDIATVIGGSRIDHARSGTANIGVLDVYKAVKQGIWAQEKIRDDFPINVIDKAVREGFIKLYGQKQDVTGIVAAVVAEYEAKLAREIERRISTGAAMNAVVFVGGGSALFKDIATTFRNGHMAEDPEFANARGLYKYVRYQNQDA
ncbi:ParM/StbA family protein [Agrobacterium rubi]|nr:ParM/StbA family protein [Agrobacterium rubi]NTF23639.1 ParM/StbA family protein [Agrobacterium rubi]